MTSLPGGAADKLGNRYEGWWTAYRAAAVLEGLASTLRLEPPGDAGAGVEFWIDEPGGRWFEQVKGGGSAAWTIRRLIRDGVMSGVLPHLVAGHLVRIVVAMQATQLAGLANRARSATDLTEFKSICTGDLLADFQTLTSDWACTEPDAWGYLRRITVEHHPPESLRRFVTATYQRIVDGDPEAVIDDLRSWFDDQLHQSLNAPVIWEHLKQRGFRRRLLAGDTGTLDALQATVLRHALRTGAASPHGGLVSHIGTNRVVDRLRADDGKQIVVVHGRAGYGKSTVAAGAIRELTSAGWYAAAVRMDGVGPGTNTAVALGQAFGLDGSPAILLGGVAGDSPSVLLVDQLDAVSTYSGRMPDAFDAVAEIVNELETMPNPRLLLVVRTVDLEGDPRLRHLTSMTDRVEKVGIDELQEQDLRDGLAAAGIDPTTIAAVTLELLRVPLHFAIFTRLPDEARSVQYRTLQELYDAFTKEVRQSIESQLGSLDWPAITEPIVSYMSDNEMLTVPAHLLNESPQTQVGALESSAVLIRDGSRVGWFHESFFDYLFARAFVSSGQSLLDFLANSGQHLFRRAQTRQVLEHLAAIDRPEFRACVASLLTSDAVRSHLDEVVLAVLRGLDADAADWAALEPVAFGDRTVAPKVLSLLSTSQWFDAADAEGRWESWLAGSFTMERATRQLILAARSRPDRVAELVRPFVGASEQWRSVFRALIQWSLSPGLVDLATELIERGELDGARGPIAVNSDFWSILYGLVQDDPKGAARLAGAYLRRCNTLAAAEGNGDPFASGHLSEHSAGGPSLISDLASRAPREYVSEVLPFVRDLPEVTTHQRHDGLRRTTRWGLRYDGEHHTVHDALFAGLDLALQQVAESAPAQAIPVIRDLANTDIEELRFLACRSYGRVGEPDEAVEWLLSDHRNFELGWADSPRWAARELIEHAGKSCSDDWLARLSEVLLDYVPDWEKQAGSRRARGHAQYELLSALPEARMSPEAVRRLGELARKFPDSPPTPSEGVVVHKVGSPIPGPAAEQMSDDDWRQAIAKYQSDETDWSGSVPVGGSLELSRVLSERAKDEPERFVRLALTFDHTVPSVYFTGVIQGAAGSVDPELLTQLLVHAHECAGSGVGLEVSRAIDTAAGQATEAMIELLEIYARDPDPEREIARTPVASGDFYYRGDLLMAGINCTRGATAMAIARVLFQSPDWAARLMPTVEALAVDERLAVRTCASECVVALMNTFPTEALDIADRLLSDIDTDIYDSPLAERLLTYCLIRDPDRFAPHLSRALHASDAVSQRGGHVWAVALVRDLLPTGIEQDLTALSAAARRGIAEALADDPGAALTTLLALLNDEDDEARRHAARGARKIDRLDEVDARRFIQAFVGSRAFDDHFDSLFFALDRSRILLPEETVAACERAVDIASRALGDISTRHAASSTEIIAVVLRLYRQGDATLRSRCLDVIDRLTEVGAYGLEDALANER